MFSKCCPCLKALSRRLRGRTVPKWNTHLQSYCSSRAQRQPWCQMFLDNVDLITGQNLPKQTEHLVRNTNIASEIVKIIANHYQEEGNLFRFCIQLFGSYVKLKYSQIINPSKNSLIRIANEYQDFIQLIIDLFVLYYNLEDRQIVGEQTFYKSTLPFLAAQFAFSNQDIQNTVSRTAKLACKNHSDKLQFQFQKFMNHSIYEFGVRQEFQLNDRTLNIYQKKGCKVEEKMYLGTVQIINEIVRVNSPAEKMKLAQGIKKQIESSIQQFYRKNGIEDKKIQLFPEDLSEILCYIIVQANQPNIFANIQIIQLFCGSQSKNQGIIDVLSSACDSIENGSIGKRNGSTVVSEMEDKRKSSDDIKFFDQVSNVSFDL